MSEEEIIDTITKQLKRKADYDTGVHLPQLAVEGLLDLYNKEKEKNKELENIDLTTVYLDGFYDGEKKWKDKIKEKIEYYKRLLNEDNWGEKTELGFKNRAVALQELLEEEL